MPYTIHISAQELLDRNILAKVPTKEHVPYVPPAEDEKPQGTPWRNMPIRSPGRSAGRQPKRPPESEEGAP